MSARPVRPKEITGCGQASGGGVIETKIERARLHVRTILGHDGKRNQQAILSNRTTIKACGHR